MPGVAAIAAGTVAPHFIRRFGTRATLAAGIAVQGASFAPLLALGPQRAWAFLVIVAVGVSLFANVTGVVTYTVTATSGLPASEQGLATGLTTMTQLVAITLGIPVIGAIAGSALGAGARARRSRARRAAPRAGRRRCRQRRLRGRGVDRPAARHPGRGGPGGPVGGGTRAGGLFRNRGAALSRRSPNAPLFHIHDQF